MTTKPQQGMQLGRYLLEEPLGKGAQGSVFRGRHLNVAGGGGKPVIIKLAHEDAVLDDAVRERFLDEARRVFRLGAGHPNIVAVTDVDIHEGMPFIVMEYVDGVDLRRVLLHYRRLRKTAVPLQIAGSILGDMAMGLHFAHLGRKIDGVPLALVHRDVKPANTLVTYDGQTKLLDFGISTTAADEKTGRTSYGTPRYMSPEHVYCRVDPKMDVYSLAVVAWELLENRQYRLNCKNHAWAILNGEIPRLENQNIPPKLIELIESSLSMAPESRPSAYEFGMSLSLYGQGRRVAEQVGAMVLSVLGRNEISAFSGFHLAATPLGDGGDGGDGDGDDADDDDELDDDDGADDGVVREPEEPRMLTAAPLAGEFESEDDETVVREPEAPRMLAAAPLGGESESEDDETGVREPEAPRMLTAAPREEVGEDVPRLIRRPSPSASAFLSTENPAVLALPPIAEISATEVLAPSTYIAQQRTNDPTVLGLLVSGEMSQTEALAPPAPLSPQQEEELLARRLAERVSAGRAAARASNRAWRARAPIRRAEAEAKAKAEAEARRAEALASCGMESSEHQDGWSFRTFVVYFGGMLLALAGAFLIGWILGGIT